MSLKDTTEKTLVLQKLFMFRWTAVSFFVCLIVLILLLKPVNLSEIYKQPLPIVTKTIHAGDQVAYHVLFCKRNEIDETTIKWIGLEEGGVDSFYLGETSSTFPRSGSWCNEKTPDSLVVFNDIPEYVTPGIYRMQIQMTYRVNIIRRKTVIYSTEPFVILPPQE